MLRRCAFFLAAFSVQAGLAADEAAGRFLPAPEINALKIARTAVTVMGGEAEVDMRLMPAGRPSRIDWLVPPFGWVTMDADDRDPAFSELHVSGDSRKLPLQRNASAFWGSRDISPELLDSKIDIEHISLGNIDDLPNVGNEGIVKGDPRYAYFHDVDGTLFPAWKTHVRVWAEVPPSTRHLAYKYRLRPAFFLIASQQKTAIDRIQTYCKLKESEQTRLIAALKDATLVCLYRLPLPAPSASLSVQWNFRTGSNGDYLCGDPGEDTIRMKHGIAALSQSGATEVRAVAFTKEDHCE